MFGCYEQNNDGRHVLSPLEYLSKIELADICVHLGVEFLGHSVGICVFFIPVPKKYKLNNILYIAYEISKCFSTQNFYHIPFSRLKIGGGSINWYSPLESILSVYSNNSL